jgi:hypothetical protein
MVAGPLHEGGRCRRRLIQLAVLAALLETFAAADLTLAFLLLTVGQPGSNYAGLVPIMTIGPLPFLVTAGLLALVIRRRLTEPGPVPRHTVVELRVVSGFGLPIMIAGGYWSGVLAALLAADAEAPASVPMTIYAFAFLAATAIIVDGITLVAALTTRTRPV